MEHGALESIRARAGRTVVLRFEDAIPLDWTPTIEGVTEISPRETGRGQVVVTLELAPGVNPGDVVAAAAAAGAGELVQVWWGPRRLRDLYRDVVAP